MTLSFSRDIKIELIENKPMRRNFRDAMAYGLFACGQHYSEQEISLLTRQSEVAEQFQWLGKSMLGKEAEISCSEVAQGDAYQVWLPQEEQRKQLLHLFAGAQEEIFSKEPAIFAFLAGAFLACGNVSDPAKHYHLEFVAPTMEVGNHLFALLQERVPSVRTTIRRNRMVIYCKECGQIQDILTMMGASKGSLHMIDVEMFKNVRNHANRVTNCETANIDKQVDAATTQIEDIKLVIRVKGESALSANMLETAQLRVENPYASLRELVELSPTPISRSGLHHRLASLAKMAEEIRRAEKGGTPSV